MDVKQFYLKLMGVTILAISVVLGLNLFPQFANSQVLSIGTIVFFITLSIFVFLFGARIAKQENKNTYTSLILLVMMTKMFLCILLVAVFTKSYKPTSNFFLIPFFTIYLIYTIFEVHLMTRLGKDD
mgnify:CR=1 FL=1